MGTIHDLQERAKKLRPRKIKNDLYSFIRTLEEELAAYNRATINQESEDIFGKPLGFYSKATELITNGRKKAGDPFDLLESGDFLDGLYAKVDRDNVFFDSRDSKRKEVLKHLLSNNVFGLQDADKNKVVDTRLLPYFQNYFRREFLL
ncbi:hypothetical protein [Tenacibaculum sp. SZ-18]|uniref:hypothetical protein n=1 Tax=Tenacibaculum sp. SZ-18 TaxID=754423 RepID=UPI0012FE70BC|nr:hypothetical protein [Tenacibaculum sp. SZ-18]